MSSIVCGAKNDRFLNEGQLFTHQEWSELSSDLGFSKRQREVAHGILMGRADRQISQEIGIALPTVRSHIVRLFAKMEVGDRTELVSVIFRKFRASCRTGTCPRQH